VQRLESELRLQQSKHEAALAEAHAEHQAEAEAAQARMEAKEREVEAAKEAAEAARNLLAERDLEMAGRRDASASEVSGRRLYSLADSSIWRNNGSIGAGMLMSQLAVWHRLR
jgi:peptidoglycan hydrolase CwlO-like protein